MQRKCAALCSDGKNRINGCIQKTGLEREGVLEKRRGFDGEEAFLGNGTRVRAGFSTGTNGVGFSTSGVADDDDPLGFQKKPFAFSTGALVFLICLCRQVGGPKGGFVEGER